MESRHRIRRGRAGPAAVLLLAALAAACGGPREPVAPTGANVLLVTLDTTRADRLGLYGDRRPTSPTLDELGRESLVFERAWSTSSWTLPAHASLLTGMLPTTHGATKDPEGELLLADAIEMPESWRFYRARGLREDAPTLAAVLGQAGYATAGFVGGPWMKRIFGLGRGFDRYDDDGIDTVAGRRAGELTERARAWLREGHRPFFLFLNYFDPHTPYEPPAAYAGLFAASGAAEAPGPRRQRALYAAEIRYVDDQLALLFAELRRLGLWDDTWIVVTADHGELQGEHGRWGHGLTVSEEELRVPLIVKTPAALGRRGRVRDHVLLTDVMPLLLAGLGLSPPASVQGRAPGAREEPILAELSQLPLESDAGDFRAWVEGDWKLVWNSRGRHALYDLARDPGERRDLAAQEPARLEAMRERLERYVAGLPRPAPASSAARPVDAETSEALRNLGYVE